MILTFGNQKTSDELSEEISKQELEEMAELLRAAGYTIQSPTEQTVSNSQAASQEQLSLSDTSDSEEVIPSKNVEELFHGLFISILQL